MKQLKDIIKESLIKKDTKIKHIIDVDNLNKTEETIYDDIEYDDSDESDFHWHECEKFFKRIEQEYQYFITLKFDSIMKSKDLGNNIIFYSDNLIDQYESIITGKDMGYAVKYVKGHIEIDCINSGSRATYYIYAVSDDAYLKISDWFDGYIDKDKSYLEFLKKEENAIIPIEL